MEVLRSKLPGRFQRLLGGIFGNAALATGMLIFGTGLTVLSRIIIARTLGVEQYGIYTYALSWANVLRPLALAGFDFALLRYISTYNATADWTKLRGYLQYGIGFPMAIAIILSIGSSIVVGVWRLDSGVNFVLTFLLLSLLVPVDVGLTLLHKVFLGFDRVMLGQTTQYIIRPVIMIICLIAIALTFGREGYQSYIIMFIYTLATIFIVGYGILRASRLIPSQVFTVTAEMDRPEWNKVTREMALTKAFNLMARGTDVVIVGLLLGTTEAGIYATVVSLVTLINFGFEATNLVLAPQMSANYTQEKYDELQTTVSIGAALISLYAITTLLGVLIGGRFLLQVFGNAFTAGYIALVILAAGNFFNSLMGPVEYLLLMTGHQRINVIVMGVSAVVGISLNFILTPLIGIEGAAISSATAVALWNILMVVWTLRNLKIDPTVVSAVRWARTHLAA